MKHALCSLLLGGLLSMSGCGGNSSQTTDPPGTTSGAASGQTPTDPAALDREIEALTAGLDSVILDSTAIATDVKSRGKGKAWREWERMFKACMENEWVRRPFYYGPTNTITLGAIVSDDFEQLQWRLESVLPDSVIRKVVNKGTAANCQQARESQMGLEALLEAEMQNVGVANLGAAIENAGSATTVINGFQVDNLEMGPFMAALKKLPTEEKRAYLENLRKGNLLLNKVIKVAGFKSTINLRNNMAADLKADLQQGKVVKFGDAGLEARFTAQGDRTIVVESTGPFVVFAKFLKAKKVS